MLKSDKDLLLLFLLVGSPYPGGGVLKILVVVSFFPFLILCLKIQIKEWFPEGWGF